MIAKITYNHKFLRKSFSVVKSYMQDELGLSTDFLGVIDTCFLTAYAIGQFTLPAFLSSFSLSTSISIFFLYLGAGISSIVFGLIDNKKIFLILWVVNGTLHSPVFPLLVTQVNSKLKSDERGKIIGAWTTSQQLGAIGATAFAVFITSLYGWRFAFIVPGIYTICIAFIYLILDPMLSKRSTALQKSEITIVNGTHHSIDRSNSINSLLYSSFQIDSILNILYIKDVSFVGTAYFCIKLIRYSLLFWLPYYFAVVCGYDAETAGYISIIFDIGGIVGGILAGQIADRFFHSRRFSVALSSCAIGSLFIVLYIYTSTLQRVFSLFIIGLIGIMIAAADSIIGGSAANDICEKHSVKQVSIVSGFINGFGSIGAILQGYLTTTSTRLWGWNTYFAILALLDFIAAIALIKSSVSENRIINTKFDLAKELTI